jgi:hypothetical protein|tara:strand:- start:333 stop:545 length:213 start_codon:yes stop_codon:yes gene_type:complete
MKTLLVITAPLLLMGCGLGMNNGGGGSGRGLDAYSFMNTGDADSYTCETAGDNAQAYYDTGEHPNLADCL